MTAGAHFSLRGYRALDARVLGVSYGLSAARAVGCLLFVQCRHRSSADPVQIQIQCRSTDPVQTRTTKVAEWMPRDSMGTEEGEVKNCAEWRLDKDVGEQSGYVCHKMSGAETLMLQ